MSACPKSIWRSVSTVTGPSKPPPPPLPFSTPGPVYPPQPLARKPRNGLGVAALVIAIIAVVTSLSVMLGVIFGLAAVIVGFSARGRVKRGDADNRGVANAGIFLGVVAIIASVAFFIIAANVLRDYIDCASKVSNDPAKVQQCANDFRQHLKDRYNITLR